MKTLATTFAMAIGFAVASAQAQFPLNQVVRAEVPFDFVVGKTVLPAGTYEIYDGPNTETMRIRTQDWKINKVIMATGFKSARNSPSNLSFRVVDGKYFLASVTRQEQIRDFNTPVPTGGFLMNLRAVPVRP